MCADMCIIYSKTLSSSVMMGFSQLYGVMFRNLLTVCWHWLITKPGLTKFYHRLYSLKLNGVSKNLLYGL